jgi:hypothetical protein
MRSGRWEEGPRAKNAEIPPIAVVMTPNHACGRR